MDPYGILGLEAGASQAEIKRAYRRLAKTLHPDAAGASSLPAFLAVQDAYERLTGTKVRTVRPTATGATGPSRGTGAGGASSEPFREPWRADPAQARAAREQARTRRGWQGGATGSAARPGTASGAGKSGPAGESGSAEGSGTRRRSGGRPRSTRKATLGSTSYDDARDPADRSWGGASWYGPTTGEYWHVNPREYADPRKHGPGYSSRGRSGTGMAEESDGDAGPADRSHEATFEPPYRESPTSADRAPGAEPSSASRAAPPASPRAASRPDRTDAFVGVLGRSVGGGWSSPSDPIRRLGLVLVAWPPLGLASAAVLGDATGCSTYSTACDSVDRILPWLAQALIVGVLLIAPVLARVLAAGTLAALLALLPGAAIITALGGAAAPQGPPVLAGWLILAWSGGVVWGANRMIRGSPPGAAPPQGAA